jgi:hypothetical protein
MIAPYKKNKKNKVKFLINSISNNEVEKKNNQLKNKKITCK